jgi:hypothetical protein
MLALCFGVTLEQVANRDALGGREAAEQVARVLQPLVRPRTLAVEGESPWPSPRGKPACQP